MDIRQIECFVAVARKGNYTKAAEELFVSRQALSKTVKHLEKEVGEPLFISVPGQSQLKLTQKGTQLMGDAVSLVNAWEAFCKAHAAFDVVGHQGRRPLAAAAVHGALLSLPKNAIAAFEQAHEDMIFSIEQSTTRGGFGYGRFRGGEYWPCGVHSSVFARLRLPDDCLHWRSCSCSRRKRSCGKERIEPFGFRRAALCDHGGSRSLASIRA